MEACTGLFRVNGFDQVQKRQGVPRHFSGFLKRQGLWTPNHYYCAKNSTTPSTAISKEQFTKLEENNQTEIRMGVLDGGRWRIYRLDKCRIRNGFDDAALEKKSGGLVPLWDAGEGNLHHYFFYPQFTL